MTNVVTKSTPKKYKWKLLVSRHEAEDGRHYDANDPKNNIIDTDIDYGAKFNSSGSKKFELVRGIDAQEIADRGLTEKLPPGVVDDGLDNEEMTLEALKKLATEEEIELGGAKSRSAIIRKIRAAFAISPPVK